jgi:hypothetical protein
MTCSVTSRAAEQAPFFPAIPHFLAEVVQKLQLLNNSIIHKQADFFHAFVPGRLIEI